MGKKIYESAEIRIVLLNRDLLLNSCDSLPEESWPEIPFDQIDSQPNDQIE